MEKKLNNLISFTDFEKTWKPEEVKKTKRTEVGLDIVKEGFISDEDKKEMKPFYKLADQIVDKVQKKIKSKGAYENAGQKEIRDFEDKVGSSKLSYQAKCKLKDYINDKIDKLEY